MLHSACAALAASLADTLGARAAIVSSSVVLVVVGVNERLPTEGR